MITCIIKNHCYLESSVPLLLFQALRDMESTTNEVPKLTGGRPCQTTDYKLCVVCQKEAEPLVLHPRLTSYHNLLETVKERASLHDTDCVTVQKRLKDCTAETLQRENAVWHRICYSRMTNTVQRERARDRQQHSMSTGSHSPRVRGRRSRSADDVNNVTGSAAPYTRSSTRPLNKDMCFFCQTDNDRSETLHCQNRECRTNTIASSASVFRSRTEN